MNIVGDDFFPHRGLLHFFLNGTPYAQIEYALTQIFSQWESLLP